MGTCFSCRSSPAFKSIRLVHLNGFVEDFEQPVCVSQVTDKSPKHFVCTPVQLLSNCSKPLKPDTQLEAGKFYFLLPFSALQADVSPMDLASIVRKLTAVAKTSPMLSQHGSKPPTSPNRFMDPETPVVSYRAKRSSRVRSWRPILDTIRERSFNRRSESDLQEKF